jgi:hypothetical protein
VSKPPKTIKQQRKEVRRAKQGERATPFFRWLFGHIFSFFRRFGAQIILWAGIGYCVHEIAAAFAAYAGKTSYANLAFNFASSISVVWSVTITVSGLSIHLYLRERKLHRATRERLTARITTLEKQIDPGRTSSLLTSKGLTRKEDE